MELTFNNDFSCDTIQSNAYLSRDIKHYWRYRYVSAAYDNDSADGCVSGDIRTLKNQFRTEKISDLQDCSQRIEKEISEGLNFLVQELEVVNQPRVVVAVPRSKSTFMADQLYLIKAISDAIPQQLVENGAYFIKRHSDTKTTHLTKTKKGDMSGTGDLPYPGITQNTCILQGNVRGKNVILIDDIYTHGVNIDEDCAQFLFDNGAKNVVLYTLCKTQYLE